tara:strand:- start:160 stop:381 length:222 start_codon:yes stop_codon:yes gene_type:complete
MTKSQSFLEEMKKWGEQIDEEDIAFTKKLQEEYATEAYDSLLKVVADNKYLPLDEDELFSLKKTLKILSGVCS